LDQKKAEHILELLDSSGQRRLTYRTGLGGATEVLFTVQRNDELKLVDHDSGLIEGTGISPRAYQGRNAFALLERQGSISLADEAIRVAD